MNPEVKAKWIAALRSGEYKQTKENLRNDDGYCCLGVLCALYSAETGAPFDELKEDDGTELPNVWVAQWAGLRSTNPELIIDGEEDIVSKHNDGEKQRVYGKAVSAKTFLQIADAIEEQL